jgi:hypothetical protein
MEISDTRTSKLPQTRVPFTKDTLEGDFHGYRREIWSHAARSTKLGHGGNDGVQLMFMLTNGKKAIVFGVFTGWYHPQVIAEQKENGLEDYRPYPQGGIVDYHYWSDEPGDCTIIDGGGCRSENDFTNGEQLYDALCEDGFDAVWNGMYKLIESEEE